jgi:hypothetical protein
MTPHEKYLIEVLKVDAEHLKDTLTELGQGHASKYLGTINNIINSVNGLIDEIAPAHDFDKE